MIHINDDDIVLRRDTSDGRFLLFTSTDLPAGCALPWSGVMIDTGGDGHGLSVRLDPDPTGEAWSAGILLHAAVARAKAEEERRLAPLAVEIGHHLHLALGAERRRLGGTSTGGVSLGAGPPNSVYPWTVAIHGRHHLPFCGDAEGRKDGVAMEQLLMVLEQIFTDAKVPIQHQRWVVIARDHLVAAIAAERRRVQHLRQSS